MEHRLIVTTFPRAVRVIEHTLIPLKDGTTLAARIWLPDDAEPPNDEMASSKATTARERNVFMFSSS